MRKVEVQHTTVTAPQMAFWKSPARYRLFVAGRGAGKTHAGVVETWRMPAKSRGIIVAPTYPMLRDATLFKFEQLGRKAQLLQEVKHGQTPEATMIDGKVALFRSADDPERLRGPDLDWAWIDEAALVSEQAWLILLGTLRGKPGRAWATTTPRGFNWLHDTFVLGGDDYHVTKASTRSNPFNREGYVEELEKAYTSLWRAQEIEGEFVEQKGPLFDRTWFDKVINEAPSGLRWFRYYDLAASTKTTASRTATGATALAEDGTLYIRDMTAKHMEWPEQEALIERLMLSEPDTQHGVEKALHGLAAVQALMRKPSIVGVSLKAVDVTTDKISRALPWATRAQQGKVVLVAGDWIERSQCHCGCKAGGFLDEVTAFDGSSKTANDQVDAVSGGVQMIGLESKPAFRLIKPPLSRGRFQHEGMANRFVGRR